MLGICLVDNSEVEADDVIILIGKATRGYDPSQDIVWLRSEIVRWIQGNLMEKWRVLLSRIYFFGP